MKVIIVEDEITATKKLEDLLNKVEPGIQIAARLESVKDTVAWIKQHTKPDVAFFDIQLSDDVSFEIFKRCEVDFPVIFVTAYDNYLLQAFEQSTIHYLLKPVTEAKVKIALDKLQRMAAHFKHTPIVDDLKYEHSRLMVRKGLAYIPLDVANLAYVFSEHKLSFAKDFEGSVYLVDQSLTELENKLDTRQFFRVNRQYLVNFKAIDQFKSIEQSKIQLDLKPVAKEQVIIGKENAVAFRSWVKKQF